MAATVWAPTESEELAALGALLRERATGLPKLRPSTTNWTVPVRVPAPGATGWTVAVKVIAWPKTAGLVEEVMVVVVFAALTVCAKVEELWVLNLASPLYTSVTECEVTDKVELV